MRSDYDGGGKVIRRTKYNKSLRVLAETNGISLSTLEKRLRLGMNIKDALAEPTRSREVTRKELQACKHLTFSQACNFLGIKSRKLNRLSKIYDVYFRRKSHTYDNESKVIVWCALHSPILRLKHMANFVAEQLGFDVTANQIKYRLNLFNLSLKEIKSNRENYQEIMLGLLWSDN